MFRTIFEIEKKDFLEQLEENVDIDVTLDETERGVLLEVADVLMQRQNGKLINIHNIKELR